MHEMKMKLKRQKNHVELLHSFVQNKTNEKNPLRMNEQKEMRRSELFFE